MVLEGGQNGHALERERPEQARARTPRWFQLFTVQPQSDGQAPVKIRVPDSAASLLLYFMFPPRKGAGVFSLRRSIFLPQTCSLSCCNPSLIILFLKLVQFLTEYTSMIKSHTHLGTFFLASVCGCLWTASTFHARFILLLQNFANLMSKSGSSLCRLQKDGRTDEGRKGGEREREKNLTRQGQLQQGLEAIAASTEKSSPLLSCSVHV